MLTSTDDADRSGRAPAEHRETRASATPPPGASGPRRTRVTLIGAGLIGTFAAPLLARIPDLDEVLIVDPELYELENLLYQNIDPSDVGPAQGLRPGATDAPHPPGPARDQHRGPRPGCTDGPAALRCTAGLRR